MPGLVNTRMPKPEGLVDLVSRAHEAGHCHALLRGKQRIDGGTTRYGEAFGGVFALAWISKVAPEKVDDAARFLKGERNLNRRLDRAYDTIYMIRLARETLPTTKSPVQFTIDLLE